MHNIYIADIGYSIVILYLNMYNDHDLFVCLFVCGATLMSSQLSRAFPDCLKLKLFTFLSFFVTLSAQEGILGAYSS